MEVDMNLIYDTKNLILTRYPRFSSTIANVNIEYRTNLKYHTAATDGENIYFDPNYLASLTEIEREFLIAHEIMHIKFKHMYRLLDKNGQKRDFDLWNEACDAVINANLERDGFTIMKGYVNRPEALKYTAEEFYEILKREKEERKRNLENSSNGNGGESTDKADTSNSDDNEYQGDDHSLWEEAFNKHQESTNQGKDADNKNDTSSEDEIDESDEFSQNRQERIEIARENLNRMREELLRNTLSTSNEIKLGNIGESKESIDWKLLLRREIEKSEIVWSQRRSIAENNYAYRLEEYDDLDEAETEVMIDVSGSVDLELVKGFLRILKPILKHSKLKVGCFNEKFWGMVDIKSNNDIDSFVIPSGARGHSAWTEDWDLAVRSFTKRNEINKLVFTDGYPCPGTMPKDDLRGENIIWLVYGNKNFSPCCGKVINITKEQLQKIHTNQTQPIKRGR